MGEQKGKRVHSPEFRVKIAERMLAGDNVSALAEEFDLPRSMMYRWRDTYQLEGQSGLQGRRGRPRGPGKAQSTGAGNSGVSKQASVAEALRAKIAELERKVDERDSLT